MSIIQNNFTAFIFAVLIHVGFVALMVLSLGWDSEPEPVVNIVKATVVDEKQVLAEIEKLKKAEKRKLNKEENRKNKAEKELDKIKEARKNEEKKRKEEQEKIKKEQQSLAELKKLKEEEQKKAKALALKHEEEEKKIKEKQAEQTKQLMEVEKERNDIERKLAEAELQRKLDEEDKREKAAAANKEKMNTARDKQAATEVDKFIALIKQDVTASFLIPANFKSGSECTVSVKIIPGGEVADVKVSKCNGDPLFERSVDAAVRKASPLPVPKDPYVFDKMRDINFIFKPQ